MMVIVIIIIIIIIIIIKSFDLQKVDEAIILWSLDL